MHLQTLYLFLLFNWGSGGAFLFGLWPKLHKNCSCYFFSWKKFPGLLIPLEKLQTANWLSSKTVDQNKRVFISLWNISYANTFGKYWFQDLSKISLPRDIFKFVWSALKSSIQIDQYPPFSARPVLFSATNKSLQEWNVWMNALRVQTKGYFIKEFSKINES